MQDYEKTYKALSLLQKILLFYTERQKEEEELDVEYCTSIFRNHQN